jgi:hypothetical protein
MYMYWLEQRIHEFTYRLSNDIHLHQTMKSGVQEFKWILIILNNFYMKRSPIYMGAIMFMIVW